MIFVVVVDSYQKDGCFVDGEEGVNGIEFGSEDFEDDKREGELVEGGVYVGVFEGMLSGVDFDEFGVLCEFFGLFKKRWI